MSEINREQRAGTAGRIALAICLLLVLLMAHGVSHHSMAPMVFLLVSILLFGSVDPERSRWVADWLGAAMIPPVPVRAALFERPPPSELFSQ